MSSPQPAKKKQRAQVIEFFIDVARECFNIGNFNSLMAIICEWACPGLGYPAWGPPERLKWGRLAGGVRIRWGLLCREVALQRLTGASFVARANTLRDAFEEPGSVHYRQRTKPK